MTIIPNTTSKKTVRQPKAEVVNSKPVIRKISTKQSGYTTDWSAVTFVVKSESGKTYKCLWLSDITFDCYAILLPQTGLKAQGKDDVLKIAKSDSGKARFRADNISLARLRDEKEKMARGIKWNDFVEDVQMMTRLRSRVLEDGTRQKYEVLRYKKVYYNDVEMTRTQKLIMDELTRLFSRWEKRSEMKSKTSK